MENGSIDIECGWDGIKTSSTDLNKSGTEQRGNIEILDGSLLINSMGDGISAANTLTIGGEGSPAIDIKTNKFSSYSGETIDRVSTEKFYIKVNGSSDSYRYALYLNELDQWVNASKVASSGNGGFGGRPGGSSSTNYVVEIPSNATSYTLYRFNSTQSDNSLTNYNACSSQKTISSYYNGVSISSISEKVINTSNYNYSTSNNNFGPGGMDQGNSDKSEESSKGLKAENEMYIKSGVLDITTYDDGLHTNNDQTFESGLTPTGDLYIQGGVVNISATDDGIHAERKLFISGGEVNVFTAYEAIEGNQINISGGSIYAYGTDDCMNAGDGQLSPQINVTGGYVDLEVSLNGDTDCIDSNGTYSQSGGIVVARGPNTRVAAALDTDGAVSLSGGTLILCGSIEQIPSLSGMTKTSNLAGYSKGAHIIKVGNTNIAYTNKTTYASTSVYSDQGTAIIIQ